MSGGFSSGRAPLLAAYTWLVYAFLYLPIIVLVVAYQHSDEQNHTTADNGTNNGTEQRDWKRLRSQCTHECS